MVEVVRDVIQMRDEMEICEGDTYGTYSLTCQVLEAHFSMSAAPVHN